jgi:hypothetical protein
VPDIAVVSASGPERGLLWSGQDRREFIVDTADDAGATRKDSMARTFRGAMWLCAFALLAVATPVRAQLPLGCGDGILDTLLGEACDEGLLNGTLGSGCSVTCQFVGAGTECRPAVDACDVAETCTGADGTCPADVLVPDTDGDGFCDATDDCPNAFDPAQTDSDNDGFGDACDICTNVLPSFADRGHVVVGRLDTPPGDDTLKIKGRCVPFQESPQIDPAANGLRLVMQDATAAVILDATIPAGEYNSVTRAGWTSHLFPTGVTAQYKNAGAILPLINGVRKVKIVLKNGLGITKFGIRGKGGSYPIAPGGEPVRVTFIVSPPIAANGQCCEMLFAGPKPNPICTFVGSNSTLRCR